MITANSKRMIGKMKNTAKLLLLAAAALSAAYGCRMTEEDPERSKAAEKMYAVHFVADEIETKTVFTGAQTTDGQTEYPTRWSANDTRIAVSLNLNNFKGATVIPSADFKTATFDAEFPQSEVQAPYTFYALSPYSACVGATSSHGGWHFNIPTEQTPLATTCDEAAMVLAASQGAAAIEDFSEIQMQFTHLTAYGKLTLKNLVGIPQGASITSIELTASESFAGRFYYDFAEAALSESSPSRTITLKPDNLTQTSGNIADIWFACAPADLGGGTIKVDVNTDQGVLSRTVSIPAGKLAFNAGRISKFSVDMTNAEFKQTTDRWVLVTDASTLAAGDEIIIASSATAGAAYAISTTQLNGNTPGRGVASITIAQDSDGQMIIQNPSSTVEVLTLVTGYQTGTFYLRETTSSTGRYLYASTNYDTNGLNSDAANIATGNNYRNYASWRITISNKVAVISTYGTVKKNKNSTSYYRHLRLYGTTAFRTYRSSSQTTWISSTTGTTEVYIYRKEAGVSPDSDPILEQNEYGAYLTTGNNLYGAGAQLSREYINDGTVTFAILKPATYSITEFNNIPTSPAKGDAFTLNYNLISGRNASFKDYDVTVLKVDGAKVWLTDGAGNGFIVKK